MKRWKQTPKTYSEMNVCDDGEWVRYTDADADKIAYGHASFENGRKQGAAEEREFCADLIQTWWTSNGDHRTGGDIACLIRTRCAAEPRYNPNEAYAAEGRYEHAPEEPKCTCAPGPGTWHNLSCPCYKPPEKDACPACGRPWDMEKFNGCECGANLTKGRVKPPERKPLLKMVPRPLRSGDRPMYFLMEDVDAFNALVDRVNELSRDRT